MASIDALRPSHRAITPAIAATSAYYARPRKSFHDRGQISAGTSSSVQTSIAMLRTVARSVARQSRTLRTSNRAPQLLRPLSTTACRMSSSTLKPVDPPVSTALPGDSFQLLPEASKAGQAEDALFDEQVQAVKDWWASPRYKGIKRPYSAEDVVSKRGALQQSYPSSLMARKLFNLLEERAAKGEPVHTSAFNRHILVIQRLIHSFSSGRH